MAKEYMWIKMEKKKEGVWEEGKRIKWLNEDSDWKLFIS